MKTWERYGEYLLTGEWHVHTNYTDGENTVLEMCRRAEELGIPLIAFTEHVRRELTYDFSSFLSDVEKAREEFPELIILSGIEAKVLPDGNLDVAEEIVREVDYPVFAYHSFPPDLDLYIESLLKVIRNRYINAWAHPGLLLRNSSFRLPQDSLMDVMREMKKNHVLLELNTKYSLPEKEWLLIARRLGVGLVRGGDIHSVEELKQNSGIQYRFR